MRKEGDKLVSEGKDMQSLDENYFCHIIIPSKNFQKSKIFYENVFGWKVEQQPDSNSLDVLPPSGKGPSAELNSEVKIIIPSIRTSNIDAKLELIKKFGGKKLTGKTSIGKDGEHGYYALFEDPQGNTMCLYSPK